MGSLIHLLIISANIYRGPAYLGEQETTFLPNGAFIQA